MIDSIADAVRESLERVPSGTLLADDLPGQEGVVHSRRSEKAPLHSSS